GIWHRSFLLDFPLWPRGKLGLSFRLPFSSDLSPSSALFWHARRRRYKASVCSGRHPGLSFSCDASVFYISYRRYPFSGIAYPLWESERTHFLFYFLLLRIQDKKS